jgi:hypothetical protein
MAFRDILRSQPKPDADPEQLRQQQFATMALEHLARGLEYTLPRPVERLGKPGESVTTSVKVVPAGFPLPGASKGVWLKFTARAERSNRAGDPAGTTLGFVDLQTPSGGLCEIRYAWAGEPQEAQLTYWGFGDASPDFADAPPQTHEALLELIRDRFEAEYAAHLEAHPEDRPALKSLEQPADSVLDTAEQTPDSPAR